MKKLSALLAAVVIAGSVAGCGLTEQTKSSGENPENLFQKVLDKVRKLR